MKSEDIMNIAISNITIAEWDARTEPEDKTELEELANSVKQHGFINPLTAIKIGNKYRILAGRRRLAAAKMIGLKTVPVYVNPHVVNEKTISLLENTQRKNLTETEKGLGYMAVFQSEGFTDNDEVRKALKAIHNWRQRHKDEPETMIVSSSKHDPNEKNPFLKDEKFMAIFKTIGQSANYLYQQYQIITQLKPEILKHADKAELSTEQKIMLTTRPLRDHPRIQENLINEIKNDLPKKRVHERVQQVAKDLETGYLTQNERGAYYYNTGGPRELIKDADKILEPLNIAHLDITNAVNTFLHRMTNHKLAKGEFEYTDKHLEATRAYRIEVVKALEDRALISMEQQMKHIKLVTQELLRLIDQELETRTMKEKISGK